MILLDTNILSELMRRRPEEAVVTWLDRQPAQSIWTTAISLFEIRFGLQAMNTGRQRDRLEEALTEFCDRLIENRILSFDADAAREAADLMATRNKRGFPVDLRDTMIAGIALSARATLATRNTRHFEDLNIPVVNPWHARP